MLNEKALVKEIASIRKDMATLAAFLLDLVTPLVIPDNDPEGLDKMNKVLGPIMERGGWKRGTP